MPESPERDQEQEIAAAMQTSRDRLGLIYDAAKSAGKSPVELLRLRTQDFKDTREVYGEEFAAQLVAQLETVQEDDREAFLDHMMLIAEPMVRRQITDSEIRKEIDRRNNNDQVIRTGPETEPHLELRIHVLDTMREMGRPIQLDEQTVLEVGDKVMEISWPDNGMPLRGSKDLQKALHGMVAALERHPEVKAITLVSWMASRESLMSTMGFHLVPDMVIDESQRKEVVAAAFFGRSDKPYRHGVSGEDVKFAFITRGEFLDKYGDHVIKE